jgi:hypothetical protein
MIGAIFFLAREPKRLRRAHYMAEGQVQKDQQKRDDGTNGNNGTARKTLSHE